MADTAGPTQAPVGIDTTVPSIARAYDAALGGTHNYEVDRQLLEQLKQVMPAILDLAIVNRNFLIRACRFLASQTGLTQYLDCGSGLPTTENVHQVVQRITPEARVLYVDNDPVVLAHGRAILAENDRTDYIPADIFKPREILENEVVRSHLDLTEPYALIQAGTMHHYAGPKDGPRNLMKEYIDALPSGSYVALTHFFDPENELSPLARRIEEMLNQSIGGAGNFRTMAEVEELFAGLELVAPGITICDDWWPDGPRIKPLSDAAQMIVGGVGRKP